MTLQCACCGGDAPGRQWWNQDTGYGICARCFSRVSQREGEAQAINYYGKPGIHHSIKEKNETDTPSQ